MFRLSTNMALVAVFLVAVGAACKKTDDSDGISPGCIGSPDQSCGSYPEGTRCPGGPDVCTPCGVGVDVYVMTNEDCTCTSGTWRCATSTQVQCPTVVGFYTDPDCTELFDAGVDAGADANDDANDDADVGDAEMGG